MTEQPLKEGDKIVLKHNWSKVYLLLKIEDDDTASCLSPDGLTKVSFPLIAIEKYDAVRAFGL